HGDLLAQTGALKKLEVVAAPEAAGVVPVGRAVVGEKAHGLIGAGDNLGAVAGLDVGRAANPPPGPTAGQGERGRERGAVLTGDLRQQSVLHLRGHLGVQLAEPGALVVALYPGGYRPPE